MKSKMSKYNPTIVILSPQINNKTLENFLTMGSNRRSHSKSILKEFFIAMGCKAIESSEEIRGQEITGIWIDEYLIEED